MYSLRTTSRPFTPSDCRHLPDEDRPVFWLRPTTSGAMHDAREAACIDVEEPEQRSFSCSHCGKKNTVDVVMRLPGELSESAFVHHRLARAIDRVDHFGFDDVLAPWPADIADRVAYVRRLYPEWTNEIAIALKGDTELDPEEEREDSDSAPSS